MANKLLKNLRFANLNYARKIAFRNTLKRVIATESCSSSDKESKITFTAKDCTLEEMEMVQDLVAVNMEVHENFISEEEQDLLLKQVEPYLKRQKYQYDHWDGAIHGYRETEKSKWPVECLKIFKRIRDTAFPPGTALLPNVHALDLAANGYIKPHIDSVKFCGSTIAGVSLLSPSIMRFIHEKYNAVMVDALLPPCSMYIIRNTVRYEFTHEVLSDETSYWKGQHIPRDRRISVIIRNKP